MDKFAKFAATAVAAFFIGEAVGVARGNRHWMPDYQKLVRKNDALVDAVQGYDEFFGDYTTDPVGAAERLTERNKFTKILLDNI